MWMINSEKQTNPKIMVSCSVNWIGTFDPQELLYQDLHHVHQDTFDKEGKLASKDSHKIDFSIDFLKKQGSLLAKRCDPFVRNSILHCHTFL